MREHSDDLDLPACLRRARRWAIALLCLLVVNGSLVALAFGGFGAAPRREPPARSAAAPAPPTVVAATPAQPTVPLDPPVSSQPTVPSQPTPPVAPAADPIVARIIDPPTAALLVGPAAAAAAPSDPPATNPPPSPKSPTPVVDPPPAVIPPGNAVPSPAAASLIVVNPPDIGGAVNFTVNGVVYALAPGEFVELAGAGERVLAYHRGDNFGYSTHKLAGGAHAFELSATGWSLQPLDPAAARKLLSTCRAK